MNTTAVKVGGAWAALEYQHEQQKAVILELCSQVPASMTVPGCILAPSETSQHAEHFCAVDCGARQLQTALP